MIKKYIIFILIPFFLFIQVSVPRFGWKIHYKDAMLLSFKNVYKENNRTHIVYGSEKGKVDISYINIFSRDFTLVINNNTHVNLQVEIDGEISGDNNSFYDFLFSDIVWKDSSGIFYRMYLYTIGLLIVILKVYNKIINRKLAYFIITVLLLITLLITLRIVI